jgi:hypothetical protein
VIAHLNAQDERRVEGAPRDLAAVLHHRVALWLAQAPDLTGHRPDPAAALHLLDTPPHGETTDRDLQAALDEVDALIRDRIEALTAATLATSPAWLTSLTGHHAPREHDDDWRHHLAVVAAHRDLTSATSDTPLGDQPAWNDVAAHRRSVAAMAALRARNLADERNPTR